MSVDLFGDVSDDIFNDPSLLQYTNTAPTSTRSNTHPPPTAHAFNPNTWNQRRTQSTTSNPRKRTFNDFHSGSNHQTFQTFQTFQTGSKSQSNVQPSFKRQRTASNPSNTPNRLFARSNVHQSAPNNTNHHNPSPSTLNTLRTSNTLKTTTPRRSQISGDSMLAPECSHKLPMIQRVVQKRNKNFGRKFWGCYQSPSCSAFFWDDDWRRDQRSQRGRAVDNKKMVTVLTEILCVEPEPLGEVAVNPPDSPFVVAIKESRGASWSASKRKWTVPLDQHAPLIKRLRRACDVNGCILRTDVVPREVIQTVRRWKERRIKTEGEDVSLKVALQRLPSKLRSALYDFQREGFMFAIRKGGRCLIADEMGLGKSIQAIAVAMYYRAEWPLLIITPSSLTFTWKVELLKWLSGEVVPDDIQLIKKSSDEMVEYDTARNESRPRCAVTIMSYGLATRKQAELSAQRGLFGMVICDESHFLKNSKSQRTKVILPLVAKSFKRALLLSGTPTNNRPNELHSQISALRPNEFMSYKGYTERYCEGRNGRYGWEARGAMHLQELHALICHRVMIRREKKDVLKQLPSKLRTVTTIECEGAAVKRFQKKMAKHELRQQESGGGDGELRWGDKGQLELYAQSGRMKIPKIKEYVKDLAESGTKFLVFAEHQEVLDEIEASVQKLKGKPGYIRIDGSVTGNKRQDLVTQFQRESTMQIAILSIRAAGVGLTLTAASTVVFAELWWDPMTLLQCEDRAHRIGQESRVNIIYLLGRGSLDDKMWPTVHRKMEVVSQTMSGKHEKMEVEEYKKLSIGNGKWKGKGLKLESPGKSSGHGVGGKQKTITSMLKPRDAL